MNKNVVNDETGATKPAITEGAVIYTQDEFRTRLTSQDIENYRSEFKELFFKYIQNRELDSIGVLLDKINQVNELIIDELDTGDLELDTSRALFNTNLIDVLEFRDEAGNTGLHYIAKLWNNAECYSAAYQNYVINYRKVFSLFKEHLEIENNKGNTPLHTALKYGNEYFISLISLENEDIIKICKRVNDKKSFVDKIQNVKLQQDFKNKFDSMSPKLSNLPQSPYFRKSPSTSSFTRGICTPNRLKSKQLPAFGEKSETPKPDSAQRTYPSRISRESSNSSSLRSSLKSSGDFSDFCKT